MIWAIVVLGILTVFLIKFAIYVIRPPKIEIPKKITYTDKSWQL